MLMKKIFLIFMVLGIVATSCRRTEKPEVNDDKEEETNISARGITKEQEEFADVFTDFIQAFRSKDYNRLNDFVNSELGVYVIFPGPGVASEFSFYQNMEDIANDRSLKETLGYFEQALESGNAQKGEITYEELDTVDACDVKDMVYLGDYGDTDALSSTYKALMESEGEDLDEEEMNKIIACEKNVKIKVYIGVGEEAEAVYFNNTDGKWYISIIDLSECGG